jgi:hypothetical protein
LTPRAERRICCANDLYRGLDPMRVAAVISLMILAMLAAGSSQATALRSEVLLPLEASAA